MKGVKAAPIFEAGASVNVTVKVVRGTKNSPIFSVSEAGEIDIDKVQIVAGKQALQEAIMSYIPGLAQAGE